MTEVETFLAGLGLAVLLFVGGVILLSLAEKLSRFFRWR